MAAYYLNFFKKPRFRFFEIGFPDPRRARRASDLTRTYDGIQAYNQACSYLPTQHNGDVPERRDLAYLSDHTRTRGDLFAYCHLYQRYRGYHASR